MGMRDAYKHTILYRSFAKYGVDKHSFKILEECPKEKLNERERYYIERYDTFETGHGLNLTKGGDSKVVLSKRTRDKMSRAKKGKSIPHLIGFKHSQETKDKLAELAKGNTNWLGKNHTEETKAKIREKRAHQVFTEETREKLSKASKGRKYPPEFGERSSLAQMGTKPKGPTSSKFYGVCYLSTRDRWVARITLLRKRIHIGTFKTEIEAAKAYDSFVKENIPYKIPLNFE